MFGKRYIAIAVSIFAIGVVFGVKVFNIDTFSFHAIFGATAVLSACVFAYLVFAKREYNCKKILAATFAVAAFSFGVFRVGLYDISASSAEQFHNKDDRASFEIVEIKENYTEIKVISSQIGVEPGEKVRLYTLNSFDGLVTGDIVTADVKYKFRNTDMYYASGVALAANGEVVKTENGKGLFCTLRRFVSESSSELYADFQYAEYISKAVTTGDKSNLDSYLYSVYNSCGVSHILAISGLHVTLIAMTLHRLLVLLSVNRKAAACISSIVVLLYAAFVGFTPGITRAAVMIIAVLLSKMFLNRADSFTTLFMTLGLLLIINPYSLFSASLELSFLASLAIMVSEPILDRIAAFFKEKGEISGRKSVKIILSSVNAIITPALMSFSTSVFSFFVALTTFDSVSYISPLMNIAVVPIFSYGLIFALLALLASAFCMPLAIIIAKPAGYLFDFITSFCETVHKADIGRLSSHVDWIFIPCIIALLMVVSLLFLERYRIKAFVASSLAFCVSIAFCGILNNISLSGVTVIEYGEGNGEYVFFRNDETEIYYDLSGFLSMPESVFENGLTSLGRYVVTGYDDYSLKKFDYFSGRISVLQIYLPTPENFYEIDVYNEIKLLANSRKCDIIEYDSELNVELNDFDIHLISVKELDNAKLLSFKNRYETVNVFIDGFPRVNGYDVAIFNSYSEDYLINASFDKMYFKNDDVKNTEHYKYINSFYSKIRIKYYNGESEITTYEP